MSTPEDPSQRATRRGAGAPTPGAAPEPGTTTGLSSERESAAAQRSAERRREPTPNMLPGRARRRLGLERFVVRVVATGGVIGVGVALGAILAAAKVQGWIIGLVVAVVSVVLSGLLWSSRQL